MTLSKLRIILSLQDEIWDKGLALKAKWPPLQCPLLNRFKLLSWLQMWPLQPLHPSILPRVHYRERSRDNLHVSFCPQLFVLSGNRRSGARIRPTARTDFLPARWSLSFTPSGPFLGCHSERQTSGTLFSHPGGGPGLSKTYFPMTLL